MRSAASVQNGAGVRLARCVNELTACDYIVFLEGSVFKIQKENASTIINGATTPIVRQ